MKKRFPVLNPITKICVTLFVGIGLTLGTASIQADTKPSPTPKPAKPTPTPKPPKPSPTPKPPKPTPTPKPGQCVVCDHNGNKPHEHFIPCDQVDKYLQDHPTSTRGPCNVTPTTNP